MGLKGDKTTQNSADLAASISSKLEPLGGITTKKMFGGHGIFHEGKMFGIVDSKGQGFLKADESNKADFEELGAHRHFKMPYFSIPKEVMDSPDLIITWAKKSIAINSK